MPVLATKAGNLYIMSLSVYRFLQKESVFPETFCFYSVKCPSDKLRLQKWAKKSRLLYNKKQLNEVIPQLLSFNPKNHYTVKII